MSAQAKSSKAAKPKTQKKRTWRPFSRLKDLFFVRRFPKFFGGAPEEWEKPESEEEYQRYIHNQGFVSPDHWEGEEMAKHPVVLQDVKDLSQHLLPTFFSFGQKARHYQNQFYVYQWIFIVGAFMTTLFGTLALFSYQLVGTTPSDAVVSSLGDTGALELNDPTVTTTTEANSQASADAQTFATGLSYLTAIVGAITAFTTTLSNRGEPRKRWSKTRRLTEELRAHYFRYLAHLPPYDTSERVQRLRELVVAMQIKEQENV
ncbi:MAG: DUF4231 domain-containing protein [Anaerolineaceae bacterium]|nr:DUF4231 domain-containing protein [Anaerolineaceae bacterium]